MKAIAEPQPDDDDRLSQLWPVEAVMARLSVGKSTVFALITSGELRSVKVGRRRLISEAAIREFIQKVDNGGSAA
ncbi:helix-turn-helix domain-containing protein [Mycolicibacterium neoaurum]|uniref:helix-turn-helix domain-containing protein n=2 Tax=Mycobacteriaceae TaxID=1762 RepID=UPI0002DEC884|nr:helix-turn-helix domain-containing protein [Mycolicibacterium neoaurum]AMO06922.1 ethanolamine utilization protein EutA [Mycolicibacterium neoaurum]AXK74714.1 DNA-binding protein [Mycolicibacterium neoaurum]KUM06134.1 ethanolamine utilization protein EutA [Mycolicibacterium neoaurum]